MAPPPPRRVTLRAVAAELGISTKSASNAFTRPDQLSAALREQVLATAARLGYGGPDPLAAGLRRGRVGAVGVAYENGLSYAFDDPVAVQLLAGITAVAEPAGAGLLLVPGSVDVRRAVAAVTGAVVDGLVASSVADDAPVLLAALARRLPLVVVDQPSPDRLQQLARLQPPGLQGTSRVAPPWVGVDDRAAARSATEHVIALGHRRLGVVSFALERSPVAGPVGERLQQETPWAVTRHRIAGCRDAAEAAGLDWASVPVAQGTGPTAEGGAAAALTVLRRTPRPTALLCLSDRLAEGAVRAAGQLGLQVPGDLTVVGVDDAEPAHRLGLTTVAHPHRRKGEVAARALLALLDGRPPDPVTVLATRLVVRGSSAPPAP